MQTSLFEQEPEYDLIAIDAPWGEDAGGGGRGAQEHYQLIRRRETILRVIIDARMPNGTRAWNPAAQCHLRCWSTTLALPSAMWLVSALGFEYATHEIWVKAGQWCLDGEVVDAIRTCIELLKGGHETGTRGALAILEDLLDDRYDGGNTGLGQYRRSAHELLILGTRGGFARGPEATRTTSIIGGKPIPVPRDSKGKKIHSRKPIEAYVHMEGTSPYRRRLEMFARTQREGWDAWGNEADGVDGTKLVETLEASPESPLLAASGIGVHT